MKESQEHRAGAESGVETRMGRRRLIEAMGLAGGALAASALLPTKWVRPVASEGHLPTPTPISPVLGTGDLQVTVTWDTDGTDIDTWVQEPTGDWVYWGNATGPTASLDVDDVNGFGPENVFVPAGGAAAGVYKVYVGYYWGPAVTVGAAQFEALPTTVSIQITTFDGTPQKQQQTYTRILTNADSTCTLFAVADVTFPAGSIAEQAGELANPIWGPCVVGAPAGAARRKG